MTLRTKHVKSIHITIFPYLLSRLKSVSELTQNFVLLKKILFSFTRRISLFCLNTVHHFHVKNKKCHRRKSAQERKKNGNE